MKIVVVARVVLLAAFAALTGACQGDFPDESFGGGGSSSGETSAQSTGTDSTTGSQSTTGSSTTASTGTSVSPCVLDQSSVDACVLQ